MHFNYFKNIFIMEKKPIVVGMGELLWDVLPTEKKAGGAHMTITGAVRKIDDFEQMITMWDGTRIPMGDVLSLEGELFSALE